MALVPGQKLGPYEIVELAGKGGMGEVYKAKDTRLDRIVAIKILPASLADNPDLRKRFDREAKAISSLNHPSICTLYDVGHREGIDFLVMEYIEGETLADRLNSGKLPLGEVLTLGIQIAEALESAHRQGLIHRDLKPGNIMLTKSGAKLVDFGLAKLAKEKRKVSSDDEATRTTPLTGEGTILGTIQYMAPEQLEGRETDHRSDIFSFGAVLYEMVTGQRAFSGSSKASLIASILKDEPRPLRELQKLSPRVLERTVAQCLAKDSENRWQTAGDLKRELAWISGNLTTFEVEGEESNGMGVVSSRWMIGALAVSIVALAVVTLMWMISGKSKDHVSRQFALDIDNLEAGFETQAVVSPDGRMIVYPAAGRLWLQDFSEFSPRPVENSDGVTGVFWSPDSKEIAYGQDGRIWRQQLGSIQRKDICRIPESDRILGGTWSTTGSIALAVWPGGLYEVNENGGEPRLLLADDGVLYRNFYLPQYLPDGKTLVMNVDAHNYRNSGIGILEPGADSIKMLMRFPETGGVCFSPTGHLLYTKGNNSIWAVPFSLTDLELSGAPFQVFVNGHFPTVSNDGLMVFSSSQFLRSVQMVKISTDGNEMSPLGNPVIGWAAPCFSPDGGTLFYTADDDDHWNIWQLDVTRGTQTRVTSDAYTAEATPLWLKLKDAYLFSRFIAAETGSLDLLDPSTGKTTEFIENARTPDVSTDGNYIAFSTDVLGNADLWYVDIRDSSLSRKPLLTTHEYENQVAIAPNGLWFAYIVREIASSHVFIRRFPEGSDPIQVSIDQGDAPFWHPNGDTLYYVNDQSLKAVDVTWGNPPKLGRPRTVIDSSDIDLAFMPWYVSVRNITISPDGDYFVAGKLIGDDKSQRLYIVEDWFGKFAASN